MPSSSPPNANTGNSINIPGMPNMPSIPNILGGASTTKKKPEIKIHLNSQRKVYSTLDKIDGCAEITAPVDTPFGELSIEFIGTTRTFVDRMSTAAAVSAKSEAYHNFLRLEQPGLERAYPRDKILKAGETYRFHFVFAVPQQMLLRSCNHKTVHDNVRDAHLLLPPTFGDRELAGKDGTLDDMAPEMASVRYGVFVKLYKLVDDGDKVKRYPLSTKARRMRIVPAVEELPPLDVGDNQDDRSRSDYYTRREKKLKKGILKSKLGTLVMEAEQPKSLHLNAPDSVEKPPVTTIARVMLRFEPAEGVTQPPRLDKISSKLKVRTFYGTTARKDFPMKGDCEFDASKGMHGESIELSSRALGKVEWRIEDPANPRVPLQQRRASAQLASTVDQTWVPDPSSTYTPGTPFQVAEIQVPVTLPTNKNLVPSFHSCLISRVYILALSLSLQTAGLGGSVDLRIPIQISAAASETESNELRRASVASAQQDTDVEDGIESFFEARPPPGSPPRSDHDSSPPPPARREQEAPPDYEDVTALPPAWSHHIGRRDVPTPLLPVR